MSYQRLATDLMFTNVRGAEIEAKYGLVLRKGKTFADVGDCRHKVTRQGHGIIHLELSLLELSLKKILKVKR